jgi:hypothetical protein
MRGQQWEYGPRRASNTQVQKEDDGPANMVEWRERDLEKNLAKSNFPDGDAVAI